MKYLTIARILLLIFTIGYILLGAFYLMREGNHEFIFYLILLIPLIALAFYAHIKYNIPIWMLWLISLLGCLHLAGGSLIVKGDVLYNLVIIPIPNWTGLTIWKFDQLVHPYGAFAVALVTYGLLVERTTISRLLILGLAFMVANGAGALNEVVEFVTKITVPNTDVGGYYNTALDLFFNMLGAFIGSLLGFFVLKRKES